MALWWSGQRGAIALALAVQVPRPRALHPSPALPQPPPPALRSAHSPRRALAPPAALRRARHQVPGAENGRIVAATLAVIVLTVCGLGGSAGALLARLDIKVGHGASDTRRHSSARSPLASTPPAAPRLLRPSLKPTNPLCDRAAQRLLSPSTQTGDEAAQAAEAREPVLTERQRTLEAHASAVDAVVTDFVVDLAVPDEKYTESPTARSKAQAAAAAAGAAEAGSAARGKQSGSYGAKRGARPFAAGEPYVQRVKERAMKGELPIASISGF